MSGISLTVRSTSGPATLPGRVEAEDPEGLEGLETIFV